MIKTVLIAAISADGKIAEEAGQSSLDWTSKEDTQFFVKRTKEAGVVIMGRKTFETIGRPLNERLTIVMTREAPLLSDLSPEALAKGEEGLGEVGGVTYTSSAPADILKALDDGGYKEAALCGGSSVYGQFLKERLVDELFLTVEPVLFGTGVPLATGFDRINLELVESTKLNAQAVLMHYRVMR